MSRYQLSEDAIPPESRVQCRVVRKAADGSGPNVGELVTVASGQSLDSGRVVIHYDDGWDSGEGSSSSDVCERWKWCTLIEPIP